MRVTYEDKDGSTRVLEFIRYPDDERMAFFSVDGEGHFNVLMTKVNKIISDMHKLINGENIL